MSIMESGMTLAILRAKGGTIGDLVEVKAVRVLRQDAEADFSRQRCLGARKTNMGQAA